MDEVFDRVCERTRQRLDAARLKTLFGVKRRPHGDRKRPVVLSAVVETPSYDLTWSKLTFGWLGLKAYTKGERVLRVEATCHNAAELGWGRVLERLPDIIGRLGEMADRFCTTLDCASVGSLPDGFLDELPRPAPPWGVPCRGYRPRLGPGTAGHGRYCRLVGRPEGLHGR